MAKDIVVRITGETRDLERALSRAGKSTGRFGVLLGRVGLTLAGGLGAAAVFAANAAGNFEQALNTLQAVTGATGDQMKRVSALARKLGADTTLPAVSAKDAAEAMTELAKGGLSVEQAMSAAKGVLQLAAAAQIENAEAATITARALNAFGLAGSEAVRVADLLAASANASTAEITDVAMAMQQAGASANQLGIPIEDLVTSIGLMANAGVVGSDAGTSLKTMFMRLNPSTDKARIAMEKLGVSAFDAKGEFVGIESVIQQYSKALGKLTPQQQATALKTIFGSDAQRAANIILAGGVKAFNDMSAATGRQGAASDLAAAKMKGFKGSLEAFKSAMETLAIEFGTMLLPVLTKVAQKLAVLANFLSRHKILTMALVVALGLLAAAFIAVAAASAVATIAASPWIAAVVAVAAVIGVLIVALQSSNKWIRLVASAALAAISPMLLLATTIKRHWGSIAAVARSAFGAVRGAIQSVIGAISTLIGWAERAIAVLSQLHLSHAQTGSFKGGATDRSGRPRAAGGPVTAGGSFMVGERGPEMFVPSVSGRIIPNHALGGPQTINLVVDGATLARIVRFHDGRWAMANG